MVENHPSVSRRQVFKQDGLQSKFKPGASLTISIPARKLSSGDYILTLKGVTASGEMEEVSKKLFHVEKE